MGCCQQQSFDASTSAMPIALSSWSHGRQKSSGRRSQSTVAKSPIRSPRFCKTQRSGRVTGNPEDSTSIDDYRAKRSLKEWFLALGFMFKVCYLFSPAWPWNSCLRSHHPGQVGLEGDPIFLQSLTTFFCKNSPKTACQAPNHPETSQLTHSKPNKALSNLKFSYALGRG